MHPTEIGGRLLERVGVASLLKEEINHHLRKYCSRNELSVDTMLLSYVDNVIGDPRQRILKNKDQNARKLERCVEVRND